MSAHAVPLASPAALTALGQLLSLALEERAEAAASALFAFLLDPFPVLVPDFVSAAVRPSRVVWSVYVRECCKSAA